MKPLTENAIRGALVNASARERKGLTLPDDFADIDWSRLDYLGWRDPKAPATGYLVVDTTDLGAGHGAIAVMLRAGTVPPRTRPQCALCEDISLPNEVVMFSARRAGKAGRKGDTIGSLICSGFECSRNVRRLPSSVMAGNDPEMVRRKRIEALQERVARFVTRVGADLG